LFLQWMTDKAQQLKLAESLGGAVPMRNSMWDTPPYKDSPLAGLFVAMRGSLETGVGRPRAPKIYQLWDSLGAVAQEVGLGTLSPADGAKRAQAEALAICEKCLLP
jgi:multiple sugar transport system substrate-binding protein